MAESFKVELTPESLTRLRRLAKEAEPTIRRSVNKGLRLSGKVAAEASKSAILAASPPKADQRGASERLTLRQRRFSSSKGHTGLREGIAKGIRVSVTNKGVRVVSTDAGLAPNQKGMNRVYRLPTFRHPIFGSKKKWAAQHGADFFYGPIENTAPEMRRNVEEAMQQAAAELAK